jgi:hypothetical protein
MVEVVAHYDNSESNPRNPSRPPREVKWGEATTDEMCMALLLVTLKGQDLTQGDAEDELRAIIDKSYKEQYAPAPSRQAGPATE